MIRDSHRLDADLFNGINEIIAEHYTERQLGRLLGLDGKSIAARRSDPHHWRWSELARFADLDAQVMALLQDRFSPPASAIPTGDTESLAEKTIAGGGDVIGNLMRALSKNSPGGKRITAGEKRVCLANAEAHLAHLTELVVNLRQSLREDSHGSR
jgi:hypothetical protein